VRFFYLFFILLSFLSPLHFSEDLFEGIEENVSQSVGDGSKESGSSEGEASSNALLSSAPKVGGKSVSELTRADLIRLTDPATVKSPGDILHKLTVLTHYYAPADGKRKGKDLRGIFPCIYKETTRFAIQTSVSGKGIYKYPGKVREIVIVFGQLFFESFHKDLKGEPPSKHWKTYFQSAYSKEVHPLLVLGKGVNAHVNLDLQETVIRIGVGPEFYPDFMESGKELLKVQDVMQKELLKHYGLNEDEVEAFFNAFFLGKGFNALMDDEEAASRVLFQGLRLIAWKHAMARRKLDSGEQYFTHTRKELLWSNIWNLYEASETALDTWVARVLVERDEEISVQEAAPGVTRDVLSGLGLAVSSAWRSTSATARGVFQDSQKWANTMAQKIFPTYWIASGN